MLEMPRDQMVCPSACRHVNRPTSEKPHLIVKLSLTFNPVQPTGSSSEKHMQIPPQRSQKEKKRKMGIHVLLWK